MRWPVTVDLGCGDHRDPTADLGLDWYATPAPSVRGDVTLLPFRDASLGGLTAHQVVEHLPSAGRAGRDPFFAFFDECWRVLRPGGRLIVDVPHVQGRMAYGDPTHRRFFVPLAFSHLWDAERDPHYPRRLWRLVSLRVTRFYPTTLRLDRRGPVGIVVDYALRQLYERLGPLASIVLVLERPP